MTLPFHKLQGAGNDFIVLDLFAHPLPPDFSFARAALALCARHTGLGSDGLLTLEPPDEPGADARMRMWNPDGSEDMCGNGLRCVAALAARQGRVAAPTFAVQTLAGTRRVEMLRPDLVRAAMGRPAFAPSQVPVRAHGEDAIDIALPVAGQTLRATSLSTGSTHTVLFHDQPLELNEFERLSPLIEHHALFPTRTSIMWARPDGSNRFDIRIWERGAGETLACGTGACAVAVAAQVTGRANGPIEVNSRGGTLRVEWQKDEEIFLTGPARYVFEGAAQLDGFGAPK